MLLDSGALSILFRETGTHNDKSLGAFLLRQHVNGLGAELGSNAKDSAINLRKVFNLGVAFNALHFGLLGVDSVHGTAETTLQEIF